MQKLINCPNLTTDAEILESVLLDKVGSSLKAGKATVISFEIPGIIKIVNNSSEFWLFFALLLWKLYLSILWKLEGVKFCEPLRITG